MKITTSTTFDFLTGLRQAVFCAIKRIMWAIILIAALLIGTSCRPATQHSNSFLLAESEESFVKVSISLEIEEGGATILAIFAPQSPNLHLYSKDTPVNGIGGLGRPTLLELSPNTLIKAVSELQTDSETQTPPTAPFDLLTYPAGSVTLSLKIELPKQNIDEDVFVTYMACDDVGCRAPVQKKPMRIKIPAGNN